MASKKETELKPEVQGLVTPEAEEATSAPEVQVMVTPKEEAAEPMNVPDDGRVEYVVPMNVFGDDEYITVGLNGKNYQIEVGVAVRVPKGVKEILDEAISRKRAANVKAKTFTDKARKL